MSQEQEINLNWNDSSVRRGAEETINAARR